MSSLTSASTLAELRAAYDDNASYEEDGSVAKARVFVTVCRMLLGRIPRSSGQGNAHVEFAPELFKDQMASARTFIQTAARNAAGGSRGFSLEEFRQ